MDSEEYVAFQLLTGMSQSLCMSHGPCDQQTAWAVRPADRMGRTNSRPHGPCDQQTTFLYFTP